jgi:hypothetical protein
VHETTWPEPDIPQQPHLDLSVDAEGDPSSGGAKTGRAGRGPLAQDDDHISDTHVLPRCSCGV